MDFGPSVSTRYKTIAVFLFGWPTSELPTLYLTTRERLDQYTGKRREREDYNLVEVIGGSQPMTVEDYVAATRDEFNHDGRSALRDALLPA